MSKIKNIDIKIIHDTITTDLMYLLLYGFEFYLTLDCN